MTRERRLGMAQSVQQYFLKCKEITSKFKHFSSRFPEIIRNSQELRGLGSSYVQSCLHIAPEDSDVLYELRA